MKDIDFCYWLRGYTEITNDALPNATQWEVIKDHVNEARKSEQDSYSASYSRLDPRWQPSTPRPPELRYITGQYIGNQTPVAPIDWFYGRSGDYWIPIENRLIC